MSTLRTLCLATLLMTLATAATAQSAALAGKWLYDQNGTTIGSVRHLSADGQTATLMIGSYFQQGSHEAQVPVSALTVRDGRVILERSTMQALNAPAH